MSGHFTEIGRFRDVELLRPRAAVLCSLRAGDRTPVPRTAPFATVLGDLSPESTAVGPVALTLTSGTDSFSALWDPSSGALALGVTTGEGTTAASTSHRSRRFGVLAHRPAALALTLTGPHLSLLTLEDDAWVVRARYDLTGRVDVRDEQWLAGLHAGSDAVPGVFTRVRAGAFGQMGLRDVRVVSTASGSPVLRDGSVVLSATCAGPGFFDTAHTGLFLLDPARMTLTHLSDLYFRRPDAPGSFGDHAVHVVLDDSPQSQHTEAPQWLVATSTWSDFHTERNPHVRSTLARTDADLTTGEHLLDTVELPLPTDGITSVGVWDPHLLHDGETWRVSYVSAKKYFVFHPVLASGRTLDSLSLDAVAHGRRATEGVTFARLDGELRVLASDGRDGARGRREQYPVLDLSLSEVGRLDAPYLSNIPWPTLVDLGGRTLLISFDGTTSGGDLTGYGTHGDLVVLARD